jgi:lipase chaperone LimK
MRVIVVILVLLSALGAWYLIPEQSLLANNTHSVNGEKEIHSINTNKNVNTTTPSIGVDLEKTSLKGTDIDGLYPVDDQGNLIFSKSIKYRFEYFLSTLGEFPLEQVLQMVRDDIELNLSDLAKKQALSLFKDYIAYKYALSELEESFVASERYENRDTQKLRFQLQQLRDKRREYFSSEAVDAFFGFDELYDDFVLSSLEIKQSQQLSRIEKEQQLESLKQSLPSEVQQMREETTRISHVFKLTQAMKTKGANQEEIFDYNSQQFGQEAAERLQVLDNHRQVWQQKVQGYLISKNEVLNQEDLNETQKLEKIEQLKNNQFSAQEKNRLPAFEIMLKE